MIATVDEIEREKYAELWRDVPEYRSFSPGMENVQRFMDVLKPANGASLLDIGCGTGNAGLAFEGHGLNVWWLDITDAGLNPLVPRVRFLQRPLWATWWPGWVPSDSCWDYGFCVDVMEHLPPEYTALAMDRILASCKCAWFQISLVPDNLGQLIGKPLHLTVRPFAWWREMFAVMDAHIDDARDLLSSGLFVARRK